MTLAEQVCAQAKLMAQGLGEENTPVLEAFCASAVTSMKARLRVNVEPEDCLADFVTAGAMYVLAAMNELGEMVQLEVPEGEDITVFRSGADAVSNCLRYQAELLMQPYFKQPFAFIRA